MWAPQLTLPPVHPSKLLLWAACVSLGMGEELPWNSKTRTVVGSFSGGSLFVRTLALHSLSISALPLTVYLSAVQWFFWVVFFFEFLKQT